MNRERLRRAMAGLALLLGIAVLSGCVGIPSSGPVTLGDSSTSDDQIDVIFQPAKPVDGASQQDILSGFIRAALNPQKDFEVARAYLASDLARSWEPDAGVTVDQGTRQTIPEPDGSMSEQVTPVAFVSENGEYTESGSTAPQTLNFTFAKNPQGEWRIASAPDGIVMSASEFNEVFKAYALYYFDPAYRYFVPDLRWFPRVASTTGTRIVRALLAGPSAWLNGAVRTAFPEGTGVTSVPIELGQARVDLSGPVLDQSPTALERMQFQLEASLGDITGVSDVQITVDQNAVTIPSTGQPQPVISPRVDSRALVLLDGKFGFLASDSVSPIDGISDDVAAIAAQPGGITSADYSETNALAAIGSATGVTSVGADANPAVVDARPGLIAPSIDTFGYIWTVPRDSPQAIQVSAAGHAPSAVTANWDGATSIVSLEVSRDGARLLAFVMSDGAPRLTVSAITRDKDNTPVSLGEPVELAEGSGTAVDATWVDQEGLTVASVTTLGNGDTAVVQQQVGGPSLPLADSSGIVGIVGSNDSASLRLFTSDGSIQQQRGSAWQTSTGGLSLLATQS